MYIIMKRKSFTVFTEMKPLVVLNEKWFQFLDPPPPPSLSLSILHVLFLAMLEFVRWKSHVLIVCRMCIQLRIYAVIIMEKQECVRIPRN